MRLKSGQSYNVTSLRLVSIVRVSVITARGILHIGIKCPDSNYLQDIYEEFLVFEGLVFITDIVP